MAVSLEVIAVELWEHQAVMTRLVRIVCALRTASAARPCGIRPVPPRRSFPAVTPAIVPMVWETVPEIAASPMGRLGVLRERVSSVSVIWIPSAARMSGMPTVSNGPPWNALTSVGSVLPNVVMVFANWMRIVSHAVQIVDNVRPSSRGVAV